MSKLSKSRALAAAVALVIIWSASPAPAENQPGPNSVATVNGKEIPRKDFDREMENVAMQMIQSGKPMGDFNVTEIQKAVLERLIAFELLYQESKKKGVKVEEQAISELMEKYRQQFPDEAAFKAALEQAGLKAEELKGHIERGLSVRKLMDSELADKTKVTGQESKTYYDQNPELFKEPEKVRASHILVMVDQKGSQEDKEKGVKKIREIQEKVKKGADFAALAKEHSDDPSKENGGDLGFFGRGEMVKPFEDTAFSLKPGEVSDVVETQFGYHLIKLTEKKPAGTVPYADVEDRLEQFLKQQKTEKEVAGYLAQLKQTASIERDPAIENPPPTAAPEPAPAPEPKKK